jgi:glycosyltransferase involved in cell wall biosynthesis
VTPSDWLHRFLFSIRPWLRSWSGDWGRRAARLVFGIDPAVSVQSRSFGEAIHWCEHEPLLSVVIPCFNHGEYLQRALASLSQQSLQDFEVILVDDGSDNPSTLELLETLEVSGVTLLRQSNRGPSAARNAGIARARGRFICCLDADDHLAPTYLEKCMVLLEGNQGIRLAYSWVQLVGEEHRLHRAADFDPGLLRYFNSICVSAVFHREDWHLAGGFDEAREAMFEDWDFWIALAERGIRGKVIREPLLFYQRQAGSRLNAANHHALSSFLRIRGRHPRLYRGRAFLRSLVNGYFDRWTHSPLLNMSRAGQYQGVGPGAVAVVVSRPTREDWRAWRRHLDELPASAPLFVIAGDCRRLPGWLLQRAESIYWLEHLLHRSQWPGFISNFLRTRGIAQLQPSSAAVAGSPR